MVLIRECDDTGKVISLTNSDERNKLRRDCLRHATRPNWEVYELGLFGRRVLEELSSGSETNSNNSDGSDSDCVFLHATSRSDHRREVVWRFVVIYLLRIVLLIKILCV